MTELNGSSVTNGSSNGTVIGTTVVKQGLAQMLKGGVIVSDITKCVTVSSNIFITYEKYV